MNAEYAKIWPNIKAKKRLRPTSRIGEGKPDKLQYFYQIPARVIDADRATTVWRGCRPRLAYLIRSGAESAVTAVRSRRMHLDLCSTRLNLINTHVSDARLPELKRHGGLRRNVDHWEFSDVRVVRGGMATSPPTRQSLAALRPREVPAVDDQLIMRALLRARKAIDEQMPEPPNCGFCWYCPSKISFGRLRRMSSTACGLVQPGLSRSPGLRQKSRDRSDQSR